MTVIIILLLFIINYDANYHDSNDDSDVGSYDYNCTRNHYS